VAAIEQILLLTEAVNEFLHNLFEECDVSRATRHLV